MRQQSKQKIQNLLKHQKQINEFAFTAVTVQHGDQYGYCGVSVVASSSSSSSFSLIAVHIHHQYNHQYNYGRS
jgi:hypothetical protein